MYVSLQLLSLCCDFAMFSKVVVWIVAVILLNHGIGRALAVPANDGGLSLRTQRLLLISRSRLSADLGHHFMTFQFNAGAPSNSLWVQLVSRCSCYPQCHGRHPTESPASDSEIRSCTISVGLLSRVVANATKVMVGGKNEGGWAQPVTAG